MSGRQLYPERPLIGVGVLIREGDKYLLIRRMAEPDAGLWSIPGGMVELGERAAEAAKREALEETGFDVEIEEVLSVVDKIIVDDEEKIKYHFVIVDYLAEVRGGKLKASSDASDARWVNPSEFPSYDLSPTLVQLLREKGIYPESR